MAITASSKDIGAAAQKLNTSAINLQDTFDNISVSVSKVQDAYKSASADELYAAYEKMKNIFPEFKGLVEDCSKYLTNVVVPTYEKMEAAVASKIQ